MWYGTDQLGFVFKIELYVAERPKYSGNNAANFTIYIHMHAVHSVSCYSGELTWNVQWVSWTVFQQVNDFSYFSAMVHTVKV